MKTLNEYCREIFGEKIYKISLNAGFTCPNRDGLLDTRGCIFCSAGGSGDFAGDAAQTIEEQIEAGKALVSRKYRGSRYIAYFQAFTNTYAPAGHLRDIFMPVILRDDIAGLSIATRPDCLDDDIYALLAELAALKPVWVELGLQTSNESTAEYIRRGYKDPVYKAAVRRLNGLGIHVITHVILGLPGETADDMLETVRYAVCCGSGGIKLQLLHVLKGTDLADEYAAGRFKTLTEDDYMDILERCLAELPEDMVVHRLTGDGPRRLLIAPLWTLDKKHVINRINALLRKVRS